MKTVVIIQARMGSSRLKNKMAIRFGNYSLIDWVIKRTKKIKEYDKIFLATSNSLENNYLVKRAKKFNIEYFLGSEEDVLSRFIEISKIVNADAIVRICADNPFIDPLEVDRLISFYSENRYDYCFNHQSKIESGHADGFGAEIFSNYVLGIINNLALKKSQREHVTKYIWDNQKDFRIRSAPCPKEINFPELKFDLDTLNDKIKIDQIVKNGVGINTKASKIINVYNKILTSDLYHD